MEKRKENKYISGIFQPQGKKSPVFKESKCLFYFISSVKKNGGKAGGVCVGTFKKVTCNIQYI